MRLGILAGLLAAVGGVLPVRAEDWPEMQGKGRRSVWNEKGILDRFPETGLVVKWRTPIHAGYAGPAVARGRVFVADYQKTTDGDVERVLCLDERTGKVRWTYENPKAHYGKLDYAYGPRATPTVDGGRVFVLGAAGDLYCLNAATGTLFWKRNYQADFGAPLPAWGFTAAPLVYRALVICVVGAAGHGKLMALDRRTGAEVWRALSPAGGIGYSPPVLVEAGGAEQLIQWHPGAVSSLNPLTGAVYWEQPFQGDMLVATPAVGGDLLFVSAFFNGPMMLRLAVTAPAGKDRPGAEVLWRGKSSSEVLTDGLHALMCTPAIWRGFVYGVCSYGQLRCLDARTGQRIWETQEVTREKARWANAFIVRNGDRFFINNDRGELIIAELCPGGYREISRTKLIKPTSPGAGRRELGAVNWSPPAYANRHILIRNDEEIIRASLEKKR